MNRRYAVALAALAGVAGLLLRYGPPLLVGRATTGGTLPGLPVIETVGVTVTLFSQVANVVGTVGLLAVALALGAHLGRGLDLAREYRDLTGAVAVGSALPVLAATAVLGVTTPRLAASSLASVLVTVSGVVAGLMEVSLPVVVGAFAGAALVHLRGESGRRDGTRTRERQTSRPDVDPDDD